MPSEAPDEADEADTEDDPTTRQEYLAAKHDRAGTPGDGPSDPAHDFEGVGGGFDPGTLDVGPDSGEAAKSADGSGSDTLQKSVNEAAAAMYDSQEAAVAALDDLEMPDVDVHAKLQDQRLSEREILLEVRDELRDLDSPSPATKAALEKAISRSDGQSTQDAGGDPTRLMAETLEALEDVDEALEADQQAEAEREMVAALNEYVAAGGTLTDSVTEVLEWVTENAERAENGAAV